MKPLNPAFKSRLDKAADLVTANRTDEAMPIVSDVLNQEPDCWQALYLAGTGFLKLEQPGLATHCYKRVTEIVPGLPDAWNALGRCYDQRGDYDTSEKMFRRVLMKDTKNPHALNNLGMTLMKKFRPKEALVYFEKAREVKPDLRALDDNEALARLCLKDWKNGWEQYDKGVGTSFDRKDRKYRGEPMWDGMPDRDIAIFTEQGLGDEIMFASVIPDAIRDSRSVVIECDKRLKGLFHRSFNVPVYGARYNEDVDWLGKHNFTHRASVCSLPKFYRLTDDAFPGVPYLTADPERRKMVRALLDSLPGRKKVGLAWTGGRQATGEGYRSVDLDQLKPLIDAFPDCSFVSLQYKKAEEKHGVRHFPYLTQTQDYDDTAALVAELDAVVCVTTAVLHLSGALGKRAFCLVSDKPIWRYGAEGSEMVWYKSVSLHRQKQGDWKPAIESVIEGLKSWLA